MISFPLVRFVLTAARRDKLVMTFLLMIALAAGLSVFLGSASLTEQESFALVFGAGGLRFLGVLGITLFCCFYVRRCFDTKEVEFLLSRPLSRLTFLFSHALAFMLIALFMTAGIVLAVALLGKPDPGGLVMWGASVAVENMIVAVTALFFSMVLSSAAGSALATLGFYVLARLIGMLLGIAALPPETMVFAVLNNALEVISIIVPRLDMIGQTSWLVYGVSGAGDIGLMKDASDLAIRAVQVLGVSGYILLQGVVFIPLLLAASAFDFIRRQF